MKKTKSQFHVLQAAALYASLGDSNCPYTASLTSIQPRPMIATASSFNLSSRSPLGSSSCGWTGQEPQHDHKV